MEFLNHYNITSEPNLGSPELATREDLQCLEDLFANDHDENENDLDYIKDEECLTYDDSAHDNDEMSFCYQAALDQDNGEPDSYDALSNLQILPKTLNELRLDDIISLVQEVKNVNWETRDVSSLDALAAHVEPFKNHATDKEWDNLLRLGSVQAVVRVMRMHAWMPQIQLSGAAVLSNMAESHEPCRIEVLKCHGVKLLLETMSNCREKQGTVWCAVWALRNLVMRGGMNPSPEFDGQCVLHAGSIKTLVKTLEAYSEDPLICFGVCCCLNVLTASNSNAIRQANRAGVLRTLDKVCLRFDDMPHVQAQAAILLQNLRSVWDCYCLSPTQPLC